MRFKFTILLIFLNAAAIGFLYYQEYRKNLALDYRLASPVVLPDAIDIHRMVIEIQTDELRETRELEKLRDKWRIIRPFEWPANDNAVQRILNQLRILKREVTIPLRDVEQSGQTLADFGLENPQFQLTYWSGAGESTLKIGAPTRMGRRLYLLPPDSDEILVVDQDLMQSIALPLDNLRSQRIFDIPLFDIRSLVIQTGDSRIRLERRGESGWHFETPIQSRASDERVNHTLNMLLAANALRLLTGEEADEEALGFGSNSQRISIGNGNRRQTLVLGNRVAENEEQTKPLRYAMLESPSGTSNPFEVEASGFEWLEKALEELRERRFMQFDPTAVNTLEITQGADQVTLQRLEQSPDRASSQWQVLARSGNGHPHTQPGDPDLILSLLEDLRAIDAVGFVSDAPSRSNLEAWGLEPAEMTVKIGGDRPHKLLLGKIAEKAPHNVFARLASAPFVYEIRPRIFTQLHADPLYYRLRVLEPFPGAARVQSFKLTDLENDQELFNLTRENASQSWADITAGEDSESQSALLTMISAARAFPVRNYLYAKFEPLPVLPWRYRVDCEILLPGGEQQQVETRSFYFSRRDGASRQVCGSPETEMTFTLTQAIIDALYKLTEKRDQPAIPDQPEAVEEADPTSLEIPQADEPE